MQDYESATTIALDMWEKVYHDSLLVALTDTFSSDIFYRVSSAPSDPRFPY